MLGNESSYIYKDYRRYVALIFGDPSIGRRLKFYYLKKIFKNIIKTDDKIYDAGCGQGYFSFYLNKKYENVNIFGLDYNKMNIKKCNYIKKKLLVKNCYFKEGNMTQFKKENFYDKIIAISTTHYVGNLDILIFKNFFYSLKRSGLLILIAPNAIIREKIYRYKAQKYTETDILNRLKNQGFNIIVLKRISNGLSNKLKIKLQYLSKKKNFVLRLGYLGLFIISLILTRFDKYFNQNQNASWLIIAKKK